MILTTTTRRRQTLISTNVPFTYYLRWTQHDIHYYGSRYAWHCHPDDLWTIYFSSSEKVKETIQVYGDPDVIEVRQRFTDGDWATRVAKCRAWEDSVIRSTNAVKDPRWLNGNCGGATFYNAGMMSVKDAVTGELVGNCPIDHPKVIAGDWVHHSTGVASPVRECQFCSSMISVQNLRDHEDHCQANPQRKTRRCRWCSQEFTDRRNHVRHERHCETNPEHEPLPEHKCQYCSKIYLDAGKRNDHERHCNHNPKRQDTPVFECQYCSTKFNNQRMMHSYHEKHCEQNPNRIEWPDLKCQFCEKQFNTTGTLGQHTRVCRNNPDRIKQQCQYCSKDIGGGSGNLVQHERGCKLNPLR